MTLLGALGCEAKPSALAGIDQGEDAPVDPDNSLLGGEWSTECEPNYKWLTQREPDPCASQSFFDLNYIPDDSFSGNPSYNERQGAFIKRLKLDCAMSNAAITAKLASPEFEQLLTTLPEFVSDKFVLRAYYSVTPDAVIVPGNIGIYILPKGSDTSFAPERIARIRIGNHIFRGPDPKDASRLIDRDLITPSIWSTIPFNARYGHELSFQERKRLCDQRENVTFAHVFHTQLLAILEPYVERVLAFVLAECVSN